MIKSITAINYLGESVEIELTDADPEHGLLVESVTGLGPAKANVTTTNLSTGDGSYYNYSRLEQRNIVLSLIFTEAPTIEDARHNTYKYFPLKKPVDLIIETDRRTVTTRGYVESNEPNIWSDQENTQISIICPDPYLYSQEKHLTTFFGVQPMFEFPFDNNSLDERVIEMGAIERTQIKNVFYDGDAEVGITINIHAIGDVGKITIYNLDTKEHMIVDNERLQAITGSSLIAGDDIIINTMRGEKSVHLLRAGIVYNVLNGLERGSDWFKITKGNNYFAYTTDYGFENLIFNIENRILYEGV